MFLILIEMTTEIIKTIHVYIALHIGTKYWRNSIKQGRLLSASEEPELIFRKIYLLCISFCILIFYLPVFHFLYLS